MNDNLTAQELEILGVPNESIAEELGLLESSATYFDENMLDLISALQDGINFL